MSDPKLYPVKLLRNAERPNAIYYAGSVYGFPAPEAAKLIKDGAAIAFREGELAEAAWRDFPEELLHETPEPAPAAAPPAEPPVKLEHKADPNLAPAEKPEPAAPVSVAEIRANDGVLPSGPDAPAPPKPGATPGAGSRRRR